MCFITTNIYTHLNVRWRPYHVECTGSLPTSEVKLRRARLVLGWGDRPGRPQGAASFFVGIVGVFPGFVLACSGSVFCPHARCGPQGAMCNTFTFWSCMWESLVREGPGGFGENVAQWPDNAVGSRVGMGALEKGQRSTILLLTHFPR